MEQSTSFIPQKHNNFFPASFTWVNYYSVEKNILVYFLVGFFLTALLSCTKPGIKQSVTLDKASGDWIINSIRLKVYNGSTLIKDSLVPWKPVKKNFVNFDGISKVDYCYNSASTKTGEYKLMGADSIHLTLIGDIRDWKILLLTTTNFNIETTSNNNTSFPGSTVITYQGFIR